MTNYKNIITVISILTFIISCGGGQKNDNKPNKQETPKALQDDKQNIAGYSRSSSDDLINEIYKELVDKTPELKNLEDELDAKSKNRYELIETFTKYESKSTSYYYSANNYAMAIKDSLLKKKIIDLVTASNTKYNSKTAELNSLINQISKNDISINDHHSVLKILLTLPIIENYQDEKIPNNKTFKDFINQQEKLFLEIDSLTPKY